VWRVALDQLVDEQAEIGCGVVGFDLLVIVCDGVEKPVV
jgi:hypothetical protein